MEDWGNEADRRKSVPAISSLGSKLDKNTKDIAAMKESLVALSARIDPIHGLLSDVAAVGRAGKWVKSVISSAVVIGGAGYALYLWLTELVRLK